MKRMKRMISRLGVIALSASFIFAGGVVGVCAETLSENLIEDSSRSSEQIMTSLTSLDMQEEAAVVASGNDLQGHMSWTLYDGGLLVADIHGTYEEQLRRELGIWQHLDEIKSIKVIGAGVGSCAGMLQEFPNVTQIDLSGFDGSGITDLDGLFFNCAKLEKVDFGNFNTSNVIHMDRLFSYCLSLKTVDLSNFDTSNVTSMCRMFGDTGIEELDLTNFDTSSVTVFRGMFADSEKLKKVNVSCFNTSNAVDLGQMFDGCSALKELDLSSFDTSNVEDMYYMFNMCTGLEKVDISSFRTPKLLHVQNMFSRCEKLKTLDLSRFDISKVTNKDYMEPYEHFLFFCDGLESIYLPAGIKAELYLNKEMYDENNNVCKYATQNLNKPMKYSTTKFTSSSDGQKSEDSGVKDQKTEGQVREFVSRMYTVALGREAEKAGADHWSKQLLDHTNDGAGLARGFICSAEFINKKLDNEAYVNTLYRTFFDREPDEGGKANWLKALNSGVGRNAVLAGFVNSQEFANLCDKYGIARGTLEDNGSSIYNAGVRNYVLRMYTKCLNRDGETLGVEDWAHRINTRTMSAEAVAKSFFSSQEFINRKLSNEDYVETLYQTFMDRASDPSGKADWVNKLNAGVSRQTVLEGFSRSPEFGNIMKSYGL